MLTGRPPFEGTNPTELMIAHARDPVVPPSRHRADIPADLEAVVVRCLAKKPEDSLPRRPRPVDGPGRLRLRR